MKSARCPTIVNPGGMMPMTLRGRPLAVMVVPKNVAAAAEARLPELVAEKDDAIVAFQIFLSGVQPPHGRLNSERRKRVRGNREASHFFGLAVQDHVDARRADHPQVVEGSVALAPLDEVGGADTLRGRLRRRLFSQTTTMRSGSAIGQRFEHHAADDAEDGRGRANPERQARERREW